MDHYTPPWSTGEIQAEFPEEIPENLYAFIVLGETPIKYSTGVQYERNDYVYGRYGVIDGAKDEVQFKGIEIYQDYPSAPFSNGIYYGVYYELLYTNKGNDISGVVISENIISSILSTDTLYYKDIDSGKMVANTFHGLSANGPWMCIPVHYSGIDTKSVGMILNPNPETYSYKYISRGTIISSGNLVLGDEPSAPTNPATYDEGNYRYTFSRWELTVSGRDRTHTAVFSSAFLYKWNQYNLQAVYRTQSGRSQLGIKRGAQTTVGDPKVTTSLGGVTYIGYGIIDDNSTAQMTLSSPSIYYGEPGTRTFVFNSLSDVSGSVASSNNWEFYIHCNINPPSTTTSGIYAGTLTITKDENYHGIMNGFSYYSYTYTFMLNYSWKVHTEDIQGSVLHGQVSSTNANAYPINGASGSYWYARQ